MHRLWGALRTWPCRHGTASPGEKVTVTGSAGFPGSPYTSTAAADGTPYDPAPPSSPPLPPRVLGSGRWGTHHIPFLGLVRSLKRRAGPNGSSATSGAAQKRTLRRLGWAGRGGCWAGGVTHCCLPAPRAGTWSVTIAPDSADGLHHLEGTYTLAISGDRSKARGRAVQ